MIVYRGRSRSEAYAALKFVLLERGAHVRWDAKLEPDHTYTFTVEKLED